MTCKPHYSLGVFEIKILNIYEILKSCSQQNYFTIYNSTETNLSSK